MKSPDFPEKLCFVLCYPPFLASLHHIPPDLFPHYLLQTQKMNTDPHLLCLSSPFLFFLLLLFSFRISKINYNRPLVSILLMLISHIYRNWSFFLLRTVTSDWWEKNNQAKFQIPKCSFKTTWLNWLLFFIAVFAFLSYICLHWQLYLLPVIFFIKECTHVLPVCICVDNDFMLQSPRI